MTQFQTPVFRPLTEAHFWDCRYLPTVSHCVCSLSDTQLSIDPTILVVFPLLNRSFYTKSIVILPKLLYKINTDAELEDNINHLSDDFSDNETDPTANIDSHCSDPSDEIEIRESETEESELDNNEQPPTPM